MTDTAAKKKGLEMSFMQAIAETADKTGYRISGVKEERYSRSLGNITDDGAEYTGAVVVRLTPKE